MKSFLSLLLVLIAVAASAQNNPSNIRMSAELKGKPELYIHDLIGFDGNTYYTWRYFGVKRVMFEAYDTNFTLINSSGEFELDADSGFQMIDTVVMLDGNIYVLSQGYPNKMMAIYAYEIDKTSLLRKGPSKQLFVEKVTFPIYNFFISNNGKLLGISKGFYKKESSATISGIRVKVFDGALEQLWEREVIDDGEKKFSPSGSLIDNNGDVYLYGNRAIKSRKEAKKEEVNATCVLLHLKDKGNQLKTYKIDTLGQYVTDLRALVNNENKITIVGFYSPRDFFGGAKGYLYTLIDVFKEEIISQEYKNFDPDFLSLFNKESLNKLGELSYFNLTNLILRPDGGVLLLAEQFYKTALHNRSPLEHYNDIFILNINPDASLAWSTRIAKVQTCEVGENYYTSFALAVKGDKLFILFNDNPDNISITSPAAIADRTNYFSNSIAVAVEVDTEGKWKKNALFSSEVEGLILRPTFCEQLDPQKMFLYTVKGNSYRIGMVELE